MLQNDPNSIYCSKRDDYKSLQHLNVVQLTYQEMKTEMSARTYVCARVRKWRENEVTRAPNSKSQFRMNEPASYRY